MNFRCVLFYLRHMADLVILTVKGVAQSYGCVNERYGYLFSQLENILSE